MGNNKLNKAPEIANQADDEIDLMQFFAKLMEKKFTIVFVVLGFTILGVLYAKLQPSIYRAEAMLQIESKQGGVPGLAELDSLFVTESDAITEVEIIKSKMVIGEVVDTLQLDIQLTPYIVPFFSDQYYRFRGADAPLYPLILDGYAAGGENVKVTQFDVPRALMDVGFTLQYLSSDKYELILNEDVVLTGKVGQLVAHNGISLFVQSFDAYPNTRYTLSRVTRLKAINQLTNNLMVSEKGKQSGILTLAYESKDAQFAENILQSIAETYVRKNVNRSAAEASKSLAFLEFRLPEIEIELTAAETRLNEYQVSAESVNILSETEALLTQMVAIEEKISELQLQEIDIQRRFTPTHPTYVAFVSQMAELQNRKQGYNQQIRSLPKTQQELLRLRRDVEVNTQIYTQLLNSIQELNILKAGTVGNVRIIDDAVANFYQAVKPKRALIVVLAAMLGGMLAVMYVLVRAFMRKGVENPQEIENMGLPVLAAIPFSPFQEELSLIHI